MKVLIIGAGNMGLTYGRSFVNANVLHPEDLLFLDHKTDRSPRIKGLSAYPLFTEASSFIREVDLIILGVKPQDFPALCEQISSFVKTDHLILSIMAGITMKDIRTRLNVTKVVRSMPNLPAQIGQGITVFTSSLEVSRSELLHVQNLLTTTGKTIYTEEEHMLDAATAISGSGPAYVYFFMQSIMEAGMKMGFTEAEAQLLVSQTFRGAINLFNRSNLSCSEWIAKVSSRGGTTEAAMNFFQEKSCGSMIQGGVERAKSRAIELSEGK